MARYNYPSASPYYDTPQLDWRLGRYVHRAIKPAVGDEYYTVASKYHNRPDRLAYDLYGSVEYFWVFMARNMNLIRDPIFDLKMGMTIVLPTHDTVLNATKS